MLFDLFEYKVLAFDCILVVFCTSGVRDIRVLVSGPILLRSAITYINTRWFLTNLTMAPYKECYTSDKKVNNTVVHNIEGRKVA